MDTKVTAIVLAAGKGSRMKSDIPKQYLSLLEKPVLFYSLQAFEESNIDEIVLVTGSGEQEYCRKQIIEKYHMNKVVQVVAGGAERYLSVYQGLLAVKNSGFVLIHDGARPLITSEKINEAIDAVKRTGACVVGMPVKDTIQILNEERVITSTPDRRYTWIAQTPQCFSYELVFSAYDKAIKNGDITITDDAMVVKRYGNAPITMLEGGYENIKVTTPEDVLVAECFLKMR